MARHHLSWALLGGFGARGDFTSENYVRVYTRPLFYRSINNAVFTPAGPLRTSGVRPRLLNFRTDAPFYSAFCTCPPSFSMMVPHLAFGTAGRSFLNPTTASSTFPS